MSRPYTLLPFLRWLPRQTRASVGRDAIVGLSGAVLALPQSIAYALIAGLPPEYGLYAAIVPVLIACLWGSSWHLICGPTAAISIVLYASISPLAVPGSQDYITLILLLTLLAGEALENAAFFQTTRVIVTHLREQARSYSISSDPCPGPTLCSHSCAGYRARPAPALAGMRLSASAAQCWPCRNRSPMP